MHLPACVSLFALTVTLNNLSGCAPAPEEVVGRDQRSLCPDWGCTTNSPLVEGMDISRLSQDPTEYNAHGLRVVKLTKGGVDYTVNVFRDQLQGLSPVTYLPDLVGAGLQGSIIHLENEEGDDYRLYLIEAHADLRFWVGVPDPIWSFTLGWANDEMANPELVCPEVELSHEWPVPSIEAIFFRGDLYDADTKSVTAIHPDPAIGSWFNVACAGSATAKMHATRHTSAGSDGGHQSTKNQRQALLKAFTADYCGTGKSFTEIGVDLRWENSKRWKVLPRMISAYESVWTRDGAICLDVPRMATPLDVKEWLDDIRAECGQAHPLPRCSDLKWFPDWWTPPGYVRTAIP